MTNLEIYGLIVAEEHEVDLEKYWKFQHSRLDPAHFAYTLSVMQAMDFASTKYPFEKESGKIAGLLHNLAKPMRDPELAEYLMAREQKLLERLPVGYWHKGYLMGPGSAWLALEHLDVREDAIFCAIREHTGLFKNPGIMARCLRICTIIMRQEDNSGYKRAKLGQLFFAGELARVEKLLHGRVMNTLDKTDASTLSRISNPGLPDQKTN